MSALPGLLDNKRLRDELGITKAAAEAIMRKLPIVTLDGLRKTYVRREDVAELLERCTVSVEDRARIPGAPR